MTFSPVTANHFDAYNAAMARGLPDKLFFADRLDADVFVDFGCADGSLLASLAPLKPKAHLVGYDLSELATTRAARRVEGAFFTDWAALEEHLAQFRGKTIALVASSVLHEVYAYGGLAAGTQFWSRLNAGPFTHFVLRDMAVSDHDLCQSDPEIAAQVRALADPVQLAEFEVRWGAIENRRNLAHYLLKYRYTANWGREVEEDYLPITREGILRKTRAHFDVEMSSHEVLPFLAGELARDFSVSFPCPTHAKLILRRR